MLRQMRHQHFQRVLHRHIFAAHIDKRHSAVGLVKPLAEQAKPSGIDLEAEFGAAICDAAKKKPRRGSFPGHFAKRAPRAAGEFLPGAIFVDGTPFRVHEAQPYRGRLKQIASMGARGQAWRLVNARQANQPRLAQFR
jgi:hypothetical protein